MPEEIENIAESQNPPTGTEETQSPEDMGLFFGEKAAEALKESATPEGEPTSPEGKEGESEKVYAGKYKSVEELEKGAMEAQSYISTLSSENKTLRQQYQELQKQVSELITQQKSKPKDADGKPTLPPDIEETQQIYDKLLSKLDEDIFDDDSKGFLKDMILANKKQLSQAATPKLPEEAKQLERSLQEVNLKLVEMEYAQKYPTMYKALKNDVVKLAEEFQQHADDPAYLYGMWFDVVKGRNIDTYVQQAVKHAIARLSEQELQRIRSEAIAGGSGIPNAPGRSSKDNTESLFFTT